jgi:succinate dehydrogenase / fumarate reductase cytochrome b subunit
MMLPSPQRKRLLNTSVARKFLSALTGILLCLYLIAHLIGNLLLLWDNSIFNAYGNILTGLPILPLVELALLALFLFHAYMGVRVYLENKKARPVEYQTKRWTRDGKLEAGPHKSRKGITSTTMAVSGTITLILVILHVWHFKYGRYYDLPHSSSTITATANNSQDAAAVTDRAAAQTDRTETSGEAEYEGHNRDLARLVIEEFKKPYILALYIVGLVLLGMHLNHGVSSAIQSMGVSGYGRTWLIIGRLYTFLVIGGFILIPLYVFFFFKTPPAAVSSTQGTALGRQDTSTPSVRGAQRP